VAALAAGDGWRGGVIAAVLSSIALFSAPGAVAPTLHSVVLVGVALLVGVLVDRERQKAKRFQKSTEQLSSVYEKVQTNFESMKRVERLSALGQLSAGLAHEIRNPLASIAGAAEILRRKDEPDPKHARCIDIITNESRRLDGLLTNFLDFARPRPPRLQLIALDSVLDNVLVLASHGIRGKTVHCEKVAPVSMAPVECDAEQLEQVLLNLVINAIEASPDGETVTLSASESDGQVKIQVIDRGHGVTAAHVDRLFDPFFTTKEHGTGLGLPVAHQIMTQMGGTLLAQRNSGAGMTFTLILPARHGEA
jgi:two-component system sensor histidine kinase HydH